MATFPRNKLEIQNPIADDILADCPINELTIRDKAAITWKKPVSNKGWLNKLIKETFTP